MFWACIFCSHYNWTSKENPREAMLCRKCQSTWRSRAMGLAVQQGLRIRTNKFSNIKTDYSRTGLGISDDVKLSGVLSAKFHYSNTYFDVFPKLDIRDIPEIAIGTFEFVTCSDVLEHIDKGLELAFHGLYQLIKPGGFLAVSVPVAATGSESEFYEGLDTFEISPKGVKWVDIQGREFFDLNPEFHGGRGQNIAFRRFSRNLLEQHLHRVGFEHAETLDWKRQFGVHKIDNHGILIARK